MKMWNSQWYRPVKKALIVLALVTGDAAGVLAEERIHSLQAEQVLPTGQLEGPNYRIDPEVLNDGLVNTYRLDTKYGPLTVEGTPLLLERLSELRALDRIEKVEGTEVYKNALREGVKSPLKGAEALIDDPFTTVRGAAQGVGRWMSDIGRSISSKDPHQASVAQTAFGQAAAKRAFAYEFNVDPYTRFKPLQKSLDDLGWAMAGGGLTTKVAFSLIPGAAGIVVSVTGTTSSMKALVRDKSPAQLDTINRAELLEMGVSATIIDAFLGNPTFSPQDKTIIVGELASLKGVKGRSNFITSAALVDNLGLATFMRYRAQMIGRFQSEVGGVERLVKIEKTVFLKTRQGDYVGLFPIDRIAYDAEMVEKLKVLEQAIAKQPGVRSRQLWIGGPVEPEAMAVLTQRGWKVYDRQFDHHLKEPQGDAVKK